MSDFQQQSCHIFILVYHEMFLRFTLSVALHTHLLSEEKYWVRQKMMICFGFLSRCIWTHLSLFEDNFFIFGQM